MENNKNVLDINDLILFHNKYIGGFSKFDIKNRLNRVVSAIKGYLKSLNIPYVETENDLNISKEDGEKLKSLYSNFRTTDYYTTKEVCSEKLLGLSSSSLAKSLGKLVKPVIYKKKNYYPRGEIDKLVRIRKESVNAIDIAKKYNYTSVTTIVRIVGKLQKQGKDVEIITQDKHPFGCIHLLRGSDEVTKYIESENRLKGINDRYEEFKIRLTEKGYIPNIKYNTLKDFCDFIKERYEVNKQKHLAICHMYIYEKLAIKLKKEIVYYSEAELAKLIKSMEIPSTYEKELHLFLNYCNTKCRKSKLPLTKLKRDRTKHKSTEKHEAYTKEQWDSFRKLVFGSIDNPDYIKKALKSRSISVSWLYFALHFVTAFRAKDMQNIPKPDLSAIGFPDGQSFLNYMNQGHEFTYIMGEAICRDIHINMMAHGQESSKNSVILRFVVGNSMVRQIGLLAALCEAHRQIAKSKIANTNQMIPLTYKARKYHLKLFGNEYERIFQGKTFSNLKATATFSREIGNEGGAMGIFLFSVLRGHKSTIGNPSKTSANIYMTHGYMSKDSDLDVITYNFFNRGTFSCIPYKVLFMLNKKFYKLGYQDQTDMIKKLGLTPYQIESMSKTILHTKSEVDYLLNKMMQLDKNNIKLILKRIAFGQSPSKHHFTECLLRAINIGNSPNSLLESINGIDYTKNCVYPASSTCFGCPFLIGEKYFLLELQEKLVTTFKKLKMAVTERDKRKYQDALNILKNVLKEAIAILGKEVVEIYIPEKLRGEIASFEKTIF